MQRRDCWSYSNNSEETNTIARGNLICQNLQTRFPVQRMAESWRLRTRLCPPLHGCCWIWSQQLDIQLAKSTDNEHAIDGAKDIADDKHVHAGEFLRLLKELEPDEEKFYREGAEEVEEKTEKQK